MSYLRHLRIVSLLTVTAMIFPAGAAAQAPIEPGQLPGRTSFYCLWRGTPTGEIRKNNSLYALWDEPELAAARASLLETFLNDKEKQKTKPAISEGELAQYLTLLDNAFVIGNVRRAEAHAATKGSAAKAAPEWNGMFFVYDRTGKEELLSKAVLQMRGTEKDIPKLTPMTLAGISALKVERKSGSSYWAEFGKYAVGAGEQSVFEEIVNLANGKRGGGELGETAAFQEAQPVLKGGVVEFFLNVSSVVGLALDSPGSSAAMVKPMLTALKLESIHSVAGHISLEGAKTRMSGAILGDTAPGGLFDIWADGQAKPVTLGYLSPDTIYYGESEFNLPGMYAILKRAMGQMGGASSKGTNPIEAEAETRIGMPLPEALGLATGEFAYIPTSPILDENQKI